jgi:hypothetical protein
MIKLPKFKATTALISVASEKLEAYSESVQITHDTTKEYNLAKAKLEAEIECDSIKDEILALHEEKKAYSDEQQIILDIYLGKTPKAKVKQQEQD